MPWSSLWREPSLRFDVELDAIERVLRRSGLVEMDVEDLEVLQ